MTSFGKKIVCLAVVTLLAVTGIITGSVLSGRKSEKTAGGTLETQLLKMISCDSFPADRNFGSTGYCKFRNLPQEIRRKYPDVGADFEVGIIKYDINKDGKAELFVDAIRNHGNNAYGFDVFTPHNGKFQKCGEVGGVQLSAMTLNGRSGIIDKWRIGGSCRVYTFRELVNGKLTDTVTIEVERGNDPVFSVKINSKNASAFDHLF